MEEFKSEYEDNGSSDGLEFEVQNDNASESDSDDYTSPLKKRIIYGDPDYSEYDSDLKFEWNNVTEKDDPPYNFTFQTSQPVGPKIPKYVTSPLDFFQLFFTDELIDDVVKTTNEYAQIQINDKDLSKHSIWQSWVDVTREEFMAFIGVILNIGTMPLPSLADYWTTRSNSRIPFFSEVFKRDRFNQIFWMLKLQSNESNEIENFLSHIDSKFAEYFVPNRDICLIESVINLKGKVLFITHNPKNLSDKGIRLYLLIDAETGYVYSVLPYYGSKSDKGLDNPELPTTTRIALTLIKKLLNNNPDSEGYHLYTDKFFTSIPLANELLQLNIHLTGKVKPNEEYLPAPIRKPKFTTKPINAYRKDKILALAWDNTTVATYLSTSESASFVHMTKKKSRGVRIKQLTPTVAASYSKKMKTIHRIDQYGATYCFLPKSLKWWKTLFFWGMELCVINAYILHKRTKRENALTRLNFVKDLIDELVKNYHQTSFIQQPSSSLSDVRLNNQLHVIRTGSKKDCVVCSDRKTGKRRETRTRCDTCTRKPGLHIGDCFVKYHTLLHYKNT